MNLQIQIDRLILEGIDLNACDRGVLGKAMVGELSMLLARDGLRQDFVTQGAYASVPTHTIVHADSDATALGISIARALHEGLSS